MPKGSGSAGPNRAAKEFEMKVKKAMSAVELANETQAKQFQSEVADYITSHLKRPGDSSGRLARVTKNKSNRSPNLKTGWRVGYLSYLNRSAAKYARMIEFGSAGIYGGGRGFRGTFLFFRPEGFSGGKRPGRQFRTIRNQGAFGGRYGFRLSDDPTTYVLKVKNEIPAMNAYRNTFEQQDWTERSRKSYQQAVSKNFL